MNLFKRAKAIPPDTEAGKIIAELVKENDRLIAALSWSFGHMNERLYRMCLEGKDPHLIVRILEQP